MNSHQLFTMAIPAMVASVGGVIAGAPPTSFEAWCNISPQA